MTTQQTSPEGRFGIEGLECREVQAGNVIGAVVDAPVVDQTFTPAPVLGHMTATLSKGTLLITGDSTPHGLLIEQIGKHKFQLTGQDYINGVENVINGQTSVIFDGVTKDFLLQFGPESDAVVFQGKDESHRFKAPRDVFIGLGGGGSDGVIDQLVMRDVRIERDLYVSTGDGLGVVDLARTRVGRDASMTTGMNHDVVDLFKVEIQRNLSIDASGGGDSIFLTQSKVKGDASIQAGGSDAMVQALDGDDLVRLDQTTVQKNLHLTTSYGNDRVYLTETKVDAYFVDLGYGDDQLTLSHIKGRKGTFDGGAGADSLKGSKSYQLSKTPIFLSLETQTV